MSLGDRREGSPPSGYISGDSDPSRAMKLSGQGCARADQVGGAIGLIRDQAA
jgi:hypothetical protein